MVGRQQDPVQILVKDSSGVSALLPHQIAAKILSKLKEDYQNYIIWRYLDELSISEISQIAGKSQQSVRVGVHRALQALKRELENEG